MSNSKISPAVGTIRWLVPQFVRYIESRSFSEAHGLCLLFEGARFLLALENELAHELHHTKKSAIIISDRHAQLSDHQSNHLATHLFTEII